MKFRDASIFNQLFNLPHPWVATLNLYSVDSLCFTIDYPNRLMTCPLCGLEAEVLRKRATTWKPRDFLGYQVTMTACLPVVDAHNRECRVDKDQSVLCNTLFLDLILRQSRFTQVSNPFPYFFTAVEAPLKLSLPRLDDEAWRLSLYLPMAAIEDFDD